MRRLAILLVLALANPAAALAQKATESKGTSSDTRPDSVSAPAKPASQVRLNLNKASAAEFAKLPGVGAARANAIIKGRPYRSKDELLRKKIVPENVYEDIKGNVYAGN